MKSQPSPTPWWFLAAAAIFCGALNAGLVLAWARDPSNRYGSFAFLIWAAGIALLAWPPHGPAARLPVWVASLAICVIGQAGSLQVLKQVGLALLLASTIRPLPAAAIMLAAASTWTPAWGWLATHFAGPSFDGSRPAFGLAAFVAARLLASPQK